MRNPVRPGDIQASDPRADPEPSVSPELIPDRCQSFRTAADGPSVQLRLRLRLVPVRPSGDVLELRLEEIVQELLLRVLHLREDLARGCRADAIHRVRVDGALSVDRDEVCDLLRAGAELSLFVREIQLPHPLGVRVPHGPGGPSEHGQETGLAVRAFRMVRHLADPDLLMEMPALETQ